jgi:hypothetical protein
LGNEGVGNLIKPRELLFTAIATDNMSGNADDVVTRKVPQDEFLEFTAIRTDPRDHGSNPSPKTIVRLFNEIALQ